MMMILMILMTIGPEVDEEDPPPAVNHLQRQAQHQLVIFVIGVDDDWSFPLLMVFLSTVTVVIICQMRWRYLDKFFSQVPG